MCIGCITTTHYYYITGSKIYTSACRICTNSNIFFYFCYSDSWGSSTIRCSSPDLKQGTNIHQPTELCYASTQSTQAIALVWAGLKHQCSPWHYYGQDTSIDAVHHVTSNKTKINKVHQQWRILAVCETGIRFRVCETGTQTLAPLVVFQQKIRWSSDQWFHNVLIISKWLKIQKWKQKSKTMSRRGRNKRRNCQRKCFHSFNYKIDRASIRYFFLCK